MENNEETVEVKKPVRKSTKVANTEAIDKISSGATVLKMTSSGGSWATPSGIVFTKENPYQLVPVEEIESLLTSGRFRRAEPEEVQNFYKIEL